MREHGARTRAKYNHGMTEMHKVQTRPSRLACARSRMRPNRLRIPSSITSILPYELDDERARHSHHATHEPADRELGERQSIGGGGAASRHAGAGPPRCALVDRSATARV